MWIRKKRSPADFSRLSECWYRWARWMGGGEIFVSVICDACKVLFATDDYSVHLRNDGPWWNVDTVTTADNAAMTPQSYLRSNWSKST